MDTYQDVCRNPCFRSISDHLSDLFIDLLGLGADIADLCGFVLRANSILFISSQPGTERALKYWVFPCCNLTV